MKKLNLFIHLILISSLTFTSCGERKKGGGIVKKITYDLQGKKKFLPANSITCGEGQNCPQGIVSITSLKAEIIQNSPNQEVEEKEEENKEEAKKEEEKDSKEEGKDQEEKTEVENKKKKTINKKFVDGINCTGQVIDKHTIITSTACLTEKMLTTSSCEIDEMIIQGVSLSSTVSTDKKENENNDDQNDKKENTSELSTIKNPKESTQRINCKNILKIEKNESTGINYAIIELDGEINMSPIKMSLKENNLHTSSKKSLWFFETKGSGDDKTTSLIKRDCTAEEKSSFIQTEDDKESPQMILSDCNLGEKANGAAILNEENQLIGIYQASDIRQENDQFSVALATNINCIKDQWINGNPELCSKIKIQKSNKEEDKESEEDQNNKEENNKEDPEENNSNEIMNSIIENDLDAHIKDLFQFSFISVSEFANEETLITMPTCFNKNSEQVQTIKDSVEEAPLPIELTLYSLDNENNKSMINSVIEIFSIGEIIDAEITIDEVSKKITLSACEDAI